MNGDKIDTFNKTELFGTIIANDLKWDKNTKVLIKKAKKREKKILRQLSSFKPHMKGLRLLINCPCIGSGSYQQGYQV